VRRDLVDPAKRMKLIGIIESMVDPKVWLDGLRNKSAKSKINSKPNLPNKF
jgi:hypothetical protein